MSYDRAEVKNLLSAFQQYSAFEHGLEEERKSLSSKVKSEADRLQKTLLLELLEQVKIEDLDLRSAPLLKAGYRTLKDLYGVSGAQLAAVDGIGTASAGAIVKRADEAVSDLRQSVPLLLGSRECAELLEAAVRCWNVSAILSRLNGLMEDPKMQADMECLEQSLSSSFMKRFFISSKQKQEEEEAAQYLARKKQELSAGIGTLKNEYQAMKTADWKAVYRSHPSEIEQVVETLVPGALKTKDTNGDLDPETAEAITKQAATLSGLHCTLRPYQEYALKYILHQKRVLLGDEMGLGKTVEAIATMVALKEAGQTHFLVVCPASVLVNWCRETEKMSDLSVIRLHGADLQACFERWYREGGVGVTTYETTGRLSLPSSFHFGELIVDEAHYIKHASAQRSNNVKRLCGYTDRILLMTGTALENNVEEMISLVQILSPETAFLLKSRKWKVTADAFCRTAASVYLRRKRVDVLSELPDLTIKKEWCKLSEEEKKIYRQTLRQRNYAAIRRVSWNVPDLSKSTKANRMLELIDEAASEGRKVIVFSFFLDTLKSVVDLLGSRCIGPLDGSVAVNQRQKMIDAFTQAESGTVLAAQIQSGGTGLNIQTASVIILCEPQLKPSTENQAFSRAYRMGQNRNVLVYRLLAENTVDEELMSIIESKQEVFDTFADPSRAAEAGEKEIRQEGFHALVEKEIARIEKQDGENDEGKD